MERHVEDTSALTAPKLPENQACDRYGTGRESARNDGHPNRRSSIRKARFRAILGGEEYSGKYFIYDSLGLST